MNRRLPLSIVLQPIEILQLSIYDIVKRKRIKSLEKLLTRSPAGKSMLSKKNNQVIDSTKKTLLSPISLYPMFRYR
jgi:hypothetical protein